jgi:hypothetical protein
LKCFACSIELPFTNTWIFLHDLSAIQNHTFVYSLLLIIYSLILSCFFLLLTSYPLSYISLCYFTKLSQLQMLWCLSQQITLLEDCVCHMYNIHSAVSWDVRVCSKLEVHFYHITWHNMLVLLTASALRT